MICARCSQPTERALCAACGQEPRVDGRFELIAPLGQGASGTTWRARLNGRELALKEMPLPGLAEPKRRELILREAEVLRQLSHPGIPTYHEHFIEGEGRRAVLWLAMELVDGKSLAAEAETHRFSAAEVQAIVEELSEILDYLHSRSPPVIHRDLKPQNVIRRPDGRLVLVDFGAVRDHLTVTGGSTVAGTFGYMAPEQFAGDASPASDLYALGALAAFLLTRRDPRSMLDHANRMAWSRYTNLRLPWLDRLLEPDPARRLGSVAALRTALHAPAAAPVPPPQLQRGPRAFADPPPTPEIPDWDPQLVQGPIAPLPKAKPKPISRFWPFLFFGFFFVGRCPEAEPPSPPPPPEPVPIETTAPAVRSNDVSGLPEHAICELEMVVDSKGVPTSVVPVAWEDTTRELCTKIATNARFYPMRNDAGEAVPVRFPWTFGKSLP